jgi:hypothetical protein
VRGSAGMYWLCRWDSILPSALRILVRLQAWVSAYSVVARHGGATWGNGEIPKALIGVYGLRTGNQRPFGQDTVNTDAAFISTHSTVCETVKDVGGHGKTYTSR